MSSSTGQSPRWSLALQATVVLLLVVIGTQAPQVRAIENMILDLWVVSRPLAPPPQDILIVAIDEPSFQELRLPWPWPRRLHARVIDTLSRAGARAIALDIVFAEPSTPEDDDALRRAIRASGRVVLGGTMDTVEEQAFRRTIHIRPLPALLQDAHEAMAMITPDPDGVVRAFTSRLFGLPCLPLQALHAAGMTARGPETGLIAYVGPGRTIPHISYHELLDPKHPVSPNLIRDRIVLIGRALAASPDLTTAKDYFRTPYSALGGAPMAGVEIHANILQTMRHGPWLQPVSPGLEQIVTGLFLIGGTILLGRRQAGVVIALGLGMAAAMVTASFLLFLEYGLWLPPAGLTVGILCSAAWSLAEGFRMAARQRAWIRDAFGKYISPEVVAMLINQPDQLQLGGRQVDATVLFLDLQGFTTLSENLTPAELITLMSTLFAPLSDIIKKERGTLDKYIGDAIMAFWGAPVPLADHAERACRSALEMQRTLHVLAERIALEGGPQIRARIGLHSGPLIVGNIGSREQFNYSCLGDTVNVASRLEGVNKLYGTRIMLSEHSARQLPATMQTRRLDRIQVKGRSQPIRIFELTDQQVCDEELLLFARGLEAYETGHFAGAVILFDSLRAQWPRNTAAKTLRDRSERLAARTPANWAGVWCLETDGPAEETPA